MIKTNKVFNGVTVAAGASHTSEAIDLSIHNSVGYFSLHTKVTGTGTCKIEFLCSNEDIINETTDLAFTLPAAGSTVATGLTAGTYFHSTGTGSSSPLPICKWVRFKITETGGANAVVVTSLLGWE
jgi:hypothetical protein